MKLRSYTDLAAICLWVLISASLFAADEVAVGDTLTLDFAVKLALEHHPSLRIAEADALSARAALTRAQSGYYPSLNLSGSLSRSEAPQSLPTGIASGTRTANSYGASLQLQQTIYDFGRTRSNVRSARQSQASVAAGDNGLLQDLILNVQVAYFELWQAQAAERVSEEAVARAEDHLRQIREFFRVGRRAQFDVTRAEVDAADAGVKLIQARNQTRLAKLQLETAMGIHPAAEYALAEPPAMEPGSFTLVTACAIADTTRPELISARARLLALQALVSANRARRYPSLAAVGSLGYSDSEFPLKRRVSGGVSLGLPLFLGFDLSAQIEQARASAAAADATLALEREAVMVEVEREYLSVNEAHERRGAVEKLVAAAGESLNLAERQYAAGVASIIDVTDARVVLSSARLALIQAVTDYHIAHARLLRAMGIDGR